MAAETPFCEKFFAALQAAGLPQIPREFSVAPQHQLIPATTLEGIARFIQVFDRVTTRAAWQEAARRDVPAIARLPRSEVCFFSAWDFHLSPEGGYQLIEFNDNGSGCLFAGIINTLYYEAARLNEDQSIVPPPGLSTLIRHIEGLVEQETGAFFQAWPSGMFLILDDAESLHDGRFRKELQQLCELFRRNGWPADIGCPAETTWNGRQLLFGGHPVAFIVNRSTDFFWQSDDFSVVRQAYESGRVYIAPNPFTYTTRSDKRLLEWLSLPDWDTELGILPEERQLLSAHTPETHVVRADNLDALAQRKRDLVFKPLHGFGGRGLLDDAAVGRARLRRLVNRGEGYVAQRWVAKPAIEIEGASLWADLRVWAYRGKIYNVSGRASRRLDRLDLAPPGGWLPTYASL